MIHRGCAAYDCTRRHIAGNPALWCNNRAIADFAVAYHTNLASKNGAFADLSRARQTDLGAD